MSDDPGEGAGGDSGFQLAGINFPKWSIYVAIIGVAALLLFRKGGSGVTETDTSTSLLATEFDQRLQEQWEAWLKWANSFLNKPNGPVTPPDDTHTCGANERWNAALGRCDGIKTTDPVVDPVVKCGNGTAWNDHLKMCIPSIPGNVITDPATSQDLLEHVIEDLRCWDGHLPLPGESCSKVPPGSIPIPPINPIPLPDPNDWYGNRDETPSIPTTPPNENPPLCMDGEPSVWLGGHWECVY